MRAWCPRCDAVRPGETSCPVCATRLATLDDPAVREPAGPPPAAAPSPPPAAPSRLRVALAAATLVVAGLAFVAGRSMARPAAPAAAPAPATSTTVPEPGADFRRLGWAAGKGGVVVTAVDAHRFGNDRETIAAINLRVQGLPAGQQLVGLRGLRLLDAGGGVYSSVEGRRVGRDTAAPVLASEHDPDTFTVVTGPAPRLSSLARIDLGGLVVVSPRDQTIPLDTAGPWPAGPQLRAVDPGPRDSVTAGRGFTVVRGLELRLRVTSAFVGGGRAVVVVDGSTNFRGVPDGFLPLAAELRAGGRVLCSRTLLLGRDAPESAQGIVLSCPTRPVPQLTVALGVGVRVVPFTASLRS